MLALRRGQKRTIRLSLRRKIADSNAFNNAVEGLITAYVKFCYRSSRWTRSGFEPMEALVESGAPVIMVLWHQRLIMSPYLFDCSKGRICTLTSAARAGRLAGKVQERMGFDTIPMSSSKRHVALSREVLRRIKSGSSVGIAADGPRGPARVSSGVTGGRPPRRAATARGVVLAWPPPDRVKSDPSGLEDRQQEPG